jgi:hypothetical protein
MVRVSFLFGLFVGALFLADRSMAQMKKVEGYDGYKFGMTIEQAKKVKPAAKQTHCDYADVVTCLEYKTTVSAFSATVTVQFKGATPLLSQILITLYSLDDPVRDSCRVVGKAVLSPLVDKYGNNPLVKDHVATWASPEGGLVSLDALCVDDVHGVNIITYKPSSPL